MKSKQNILDEILHQNSRLLKFNHYFNNTTNKKNIRGDKKCQNKLNHQQKNLLSKEETLLSKETEKKRKQNASKRSEKTFHYWGFHD